MLGDFELGNPLESHPRLGAVTSTQSRPSLSSVEGGGLVLSVTLSPNFTPSTLGAVESGRERIARPPSGPL